MKQTAIDSQNYDLFDGAGTFHDPGTLPTVQDLYRMFDIYNEQYFENKLPRIKISYSKRMLVAGGYYPQKREIRISEKYHSIFPEEVYDTLKHEMIHIIHFRHNAAFKRIAKRIGASLRANEHPDLRRPPKYLYICPACLTEYPRRKRIRMASCGRCSRGAYDERFKLVLKKNFTKRAARD